MCNLMVCDLLDIRHKIRMWVRLYDPFVSNLGIVSAWIYKITPESSYITILSLRLYLSFVYQILSLFH